jgi:tetratricopeptide (TPR) repeat protein
VCTGALVDLGETLRAVGQVDEAAGAYRSAHALAENTGDRYERARALTGLGRLRRAAGEPARARRDWRVALALFEALGVPEAAETRWLLTELDRADRS